MSTFFNQIKTLETKFKNMIKEGENYELTIWKYRTYKGKEYPIRICFSKWAKKGLAYDVNITVYIKTTEEYKKQKEYDSLSEFKEKERWLE